MKESLEISNEFGAGGSNMRAELMESEFKEGLDFRESGGYTCVGERFVDEVLDLRDEGSEVDALVV